MNTMSYKDYLGSVAFSEKDGVFFGKIEGINGMVNFEGESVKELTEAFHEAVDDYLAYCQDEGHHPQFDCLHCFSFYGLFICKDSNNRAKYKINLHLFLLLRCILSSSVAQCSKIK